MVGEKQSVSQFELGTNRLVESPLRVIKKDRGTEHCSASSYLFSSQEELAGERAKEAISGCCEDYKRVN